MSDQSDISYSNTDIVDYCSFNDRCMASMLIVKTKNDKFALYANSEVLSMGVGKWENKILNQDFDEIIPYNSLTGVSHVAIRLGNKWGLIEIIDNNTVAGIWKLIAKIEYQKSEIDALIKNRWKNDFDPIDWLKKFKHASEMQQGFRELRAEIFQQTLEFTKRGYYFVNNERVISPYCDYNDATFYYDKELKLSNAFNAVATKFSVIEADCLETAHLLQMAGYKVCVLNMASRQNPGGGVLKGLGAQEENLFRRTDIYRSLYRFADYASKYGIMRDANSYPLDRNFGGIYSEGINVLRGSERSGYCLLENPYAMNVVSVAAINNPELIKTAKGYRIVNSLIEPTKNKIRTILRIAATHNNDCLVLSAFGCGAYRNPPEHIAEIFRDVFNENEFSGRFKMVVFAIIDDHNTWTEHNPTGNVIPFMKEFSYK